MNTLKHRHLIFTISLLLFQVILACGSWKATPFILTPTQYPSPTATSTPQTNSVIPSPKPSQTFTAIPTLTVTSTPLPPSPTWTPQPTMLPDEAKSYIMDLLQNNGGCRLPCWWGITPGLTTWLDAKIFLQRYAIDISVKDTEDNFQMAYVQIPSPVDVPYITYLNQEYGIRNGIVETIQTYNFDITNEYFLPNVLQEYGQMVEVGISTVKNGDKPNIPFSLSLFYLDKGILIEYVGYKKVNGAGNVGLVDDKIRVCPQGGTYNFLYLWSPKIKMDFDEAVKKFLDIKNQPFPIRLKEATGMDVKTFYDTFRDSSTTTCLETPKQLWPEQ